MFLRQISTLTYKFFFDPAQLGGGGVEKEYQSNSKSKILRFLLNSYFRFDEISSKMFLNCQHRLRLQENNNIRISLFRKEFYIFFLASNLRSRAKIFHLLNIKKFNVPKSN